jgi:PHP family Zn ribbon phosphoesterase
VTATAFGLGVWAEKPTSLNLKERVTVKLWTLFAAKTLRVSSLPLRLTLLTENTIGLAIDCNVSLSTQEAQKLGNICPVCRRKLTKGVEQRVEELADRPANFRPDNVPGFMRLLPLSEIIATVLGVDSPSTQAVWKIYNSLIDKFGDEYTVLIDAPKDLLTEVVEAPVADAILRVREGSVSVVPGYDGVYGKLVLGVGASAEKPSRRRVQQLNLADFW